MKPTFLLAFLLLGLLAPACKHTKYTSANMPAHQLRWGTGGGVVGKEKGYILLENGQVFSRDITDKLSEAGRVKAKQAKELFARAKALDIARLELNQPGNIYSYLEYQEADMVSRAVFGGKGQTVPPAVEELYKALSGLKLGKK